MKLLNIITVLIGLAIIFLGLNIGLGGMRSMGWQGAKDFIDVIDESAFVVQDNHIRFVGGVWFGVGVLFVLGGFWLEKSRPTLIALSGIIALAGLFRISALDSVIFSSQIVPSIFMELVGFPLLAFWLIRSEAQDQPN